jgi:hypothetical protein
MEDGIKRSSTVTDVFLSEGCSFIGVPRAGFDCRILFMLSTSKSGRDPSQ